MKRVPFLPIFQQLLSVLYWGWPLVLLFVSPAILEVLLKLGEGLFDTQITAQNYLSFLLHTTVPLAVLFELPVIVSFLTSIGILTPVFLARYRRYAYFILLVLAVVLTPATLLVTWP